ncbi:FeMo cofactor biosynthesis protein NifB [subsurface metagenome]
MKLDSPLVITDIMNQHPCFSDEAHDRVGRIHLPVAPRCNIQCNFCEHRMCAEIQHPGWATRLLSVAEAVDLIQSVVNERQACDFVAGIAGPGDALANDQTFQTLALIHNRYPQIVGCLCTNGLLLEDKLEEIVDAGVRALTVTVNAPDSRIGKHIYSWVKYQGTIYRGEEAATLLIKKQFSGIKKALDASLSVKVNTVLIPGVNDQQMVRLALHLREAGVSLMNIMPLIPAGKMKNNPAPTCDALQKARQDCEEIVSQFYRCEQCRADVVYLP